MPAAKRFPCHCPVWRAETLEIIVTYGMHAETRDARRKTRRIESIVASNDSLVSQALSRLASRVTRHDSIA
jgi:hypothetical protein